MADPRTNLVAFSKKVEELRTAQKDYFKAKHARLDAYGKLEICKKLAKEVDDLVKLIDRDQAEVTQSNLFEPVYISNIVKKGLVSPKVLAEYYSQEVTINWLNNDQTAWIEQTGKVNAITIRMAELERIRDFSITKKEVSHG